MYQQDPRWCELALPPYQERQGFPVPLSPPPPPLQVR